jgi:hypothetical protein
VIFVPVIKRFSFCQVRINFKDHAPPHFHIVMSDGREVWVTIDGQHIIHGKVDKREIAEVLFWAKENQHLLAEKFEEFH